jgi:hypothetical protein
LQGKKEHASCLPPWEEDDNNNKNGVGVGLNLLGLGQREEGEFFRFARYSNEERSKDYMKSLKTVSK